MPAIMDRNIREKTTALEIGDVIELIVDIPHRGLRSGRRGTIVHHHGPDAFEVEFTDPDGATEDLLALGTEQFTIVWRAGTAHRKP